MAKGTLDLKIIISAKDEATGAIKKLGKAIFNLRNAVIAAVGGFVSMKVLDDITSAAARQEDAEQKLAAALKAVGQFSQETAKRLKQYAGHLQSLRLNLNQKEWLPCSRHLSKNSGGYQRVWQRPSGGRGHRLQICGEM